MRSSLGKDYTWQGIQETSKVHVGSSSFGFSKAEGKEDVQNESFKGNSSQKNSMMTVGSHRSYSKRLPGASVRKNCKTT